MKTLGEVLQLSIKYLQDRGVLRPRRVAEELLQYLLKIDRLQLYMQFDKPLEEKELEAYRALLKRKGRGEPLEYLLEEISFFNCLIEVTSEVLIPRQETEILLDKACEIIRAQDYKGKVAWDLCSGSGCLGIGLKKALPELTVIISDLSTSAIEVAKKNIEKNRVEVSIFQGDLLEPFKGKKADFILCNPPYVSEEEYPSIDKEVRDFEPKMALVAQKQGLEFYERLARELPSYLNPQAKVFLEIGSSQGAAVLDLFCASCWKAKVVEKDWAGHDRFFFLEFQ